MQEWFHADVLVDNRQAPVDVDQVLDELADWHTALGTCPDGRLRVTISLQAEMMIDAAAQAIVVVRYATSREPIALELMTEREFCDRERFDHPLD